MPLSPISTRLAGISPGALTPTQSGSAIIKSAKSFLGRAVAWMKSEKSPKWLQKIASHLFQSNSAISSKPLSSRKAAMADQVENFNKLQTQLKKSQQELERLNQKRITLKNRQLALNVTRPSGLLDKIAQKQGLSGKIDECFSREEVKKLKSDIEKAITSQDGAVTKKEAVRIAFDQVRELSDQKVQAIRDALPEPPSFSH